MKINIILKYDKYAYPSMANAQPKFIDNILISERQKINCNIVMSILFF